MSDTTTPSPVRLALNQKFETLHIFKRDRATAHLCFHTSLGGLAKEPHRPTAGYWQETPVSVNGGVRKQFEPIYSALFKNRGINPSERTDFLRVVFLEFAENHWDRGYVDPKLRKQAQGQVRSRFVTQSEFAARVGIHNLTASRLLKEQKMPSRRVQCGKSERILVDFACNTIPHMSWKDLQGEGCRKAHWDFCRRPANSQE
jgi:hypothetical protein